MKDTVKNAVCDLNFLERRIQFLAQLTGNEDPELEAEGETYGIQSQCISLQRGSLAAMFIDIAEEVGRVRDALKKDLPSV